MLVGFAVDAIGEPGSPTLLSPLISGTEVSPTVADGSGVGDATDATEATVVEGLVVDDAAVRESFAMVGPADAVEAEVREGFSGGAARGPVV